MSFINMCRTCLTECDNINLVYIFKTIELNGEKYCLQNMISELMTVDIQIDHEMPATVCEECVYEICKSFFFRQQCLESYSALNSLLGIEYATTATPLIWVGLDAEEKEQTVTQSKIMKESTTCIEEYLEDNLESESNNEFEITYNDNIIEDSQKEDALHDPPPEKKRTLSRNENIDSKLNDFIRELDLDEDENDDKLHILLNSDEEEDSVKPDGLKCLQCDAQFTTTSELGNHLDSHIEKSGFRCFVCNRTFTRRNDFNKHFKHHDPRIVNHCFYCGKKLTDINELKVHLYNHKIDTKPMRFSCYFCSQPAKTATAMKKHMMNHHKDEWNNYKKEIYTLQTELKNKLSEPEQHLCEFCGREFATASKLKLHIIQHTTGRAYKCDICGMGFTMPNYLKNHIIRHNAPKNYKCEICGKAFFGKHNLKQHVERHEGKRPYACSICDKRLTTAKVRDMHERTHFGENPYQEWERRRAPRIRRKPSKKSQPVPLSLE